MIPLWSDLVESQDVYCVVSGGIGIAGQAVVSVPNGMSVSGSIGLAGQAVIEVPVALSMSGSMGLTGQTVIDNSFLGVEIQGAVGLNGQVEFDVDQRLLIAGAVGLSGEVALDIEDLLLEPYSCLAIQGAFGGPGRKAVTQVPLYNFNSLGEINGVPIGLNKFGLHKIMQGDLIEGLKFSKSFTVKEHHLGYPGNLKKLRFLYIGCGGNAMALRVWVRADGGPWLPCEGYRPHGRGMRCVANARGQGVYWSIKIESKEWFRIDNIKAMTIIRPAGVVV